MGNVKKYDIIYADPPWKFNDGHFIHIGRVWSDNSLRVEYSKNYTQSTVKRLVKAKTFDILRFVNVIKINKT
jgi:hypothetical protein